MQRLAVLVGFAFVVSACGPAVPNTPTKGISSGADAARAAAKTRDAMSGMSQRSSRQFSVSTEYNGTCATSGTVKVKSQASLGGLGSGSAGLNATLTATAEQCFKMNDYRVTGQLVYSYTAGAAQTGDNGTTVTSELKLDGRVSLETFTSTGEVDQSGVIEYNDLVVKYSVVTSSANNTFNVSYEVTTSGTMTVGGQPFSPSEEEWGRTLSGMLSINTN